MCYFVLVPLRIPMSELTQAVSTTVLVLENPPFTPTSFVAPRLASRDASVVVCVHALMIFLRAATVSHARVPACGVRNRAAAHFGMRFLPMAV